MPFLRNEHTVSDVLISLRCPVGPNVTILMTLPRTGRNFCVTPQAQRTTRSEGTGKEK